MAKSDIVSERGAMVLKDLIECCNGKSNPIKFFSADEIFKATKHFSSFSYFRNFGYEWYYGENEKYPMILIKKESPRFLDVFFRDIAVSSMVSGHKNFLKFVGCCLELEYPIMVYHGGQKHYQLDIREQTWKRRMKIAEDIATALAYLHTAFPRPFVYRTLSHKNILLDEDGVAKLTDFSFCVSIPEGETFVKVDGAEGVHRYMESRYLKSGVVSEKTDVFAFGILMQHFLIRRETIWKIWVKAKEEANGGEGYDTDDSFQFRLFKFVEERRIDEIADSVILDKMDENSEEKLCQMKAFLMLSRRCMGQKGEVPTMVEVAKELKKIQRSSSPSGETILDIPQDISSPLLLSNQT
ncbi:Protein kinase-like domain superfamily [Arabidopsis thaliana x Arabidopsis arenosa]|uniref:Protein kinase-like domain superfamily n=1 Tax=Arabidopsis thaliana x Arabidopsis arenosa TaxID=1240361 RepID=A0A8T2BIX2_9BRAS|nr:Protein kinase-like domain superfamily [Arabidopsis thaliana x Arabidopsis arenosa]